MGIALILPLLTQLGQMALGYVWPSQRGQQVAELIGQASQLASLNPKSFEFHEALVRLSAAGAGVAFDDARGVKIANIIGTLGEAGAAEIKDELARRGMTIDQVLDHAALQFADNEKDFARLDAEYRQKLGLPPVLSVEL